MVQASWVDSLDCQTPALKPSPGFCLVHLESKGEAEVDVRLSEGVHDKQVSAVSANAAEKSKKKVLAYIDDVMSDSSPTALSDEGLSGTAKVETTKASSERVDRGHP